MVRAFTPLESHHRKVVVTNKKINCEGGGQSHHRSTDLAGLTFIEILIVIGIIIFLTIFTLPLGISFYKTQELENTSKEILQVLRLAQLEAMSQENDSAFGVFIDSDRYIFFKGISYSERDQSFDEIFDFGTSVQLSGLSEIVFRKLDGIPSAIGDITLVNNGETRTISINSAGRISLE